jgi:hypothetical protein
LVSGTGARRAPGPDNRNTVSNVFGHCVLNSLLWHLKNALAWLNSETYNYGGLCCHAPD